MRDASVFVRLPVKLLSAYGALEGLARAASPVLDDAVLADAIEEQLREIQRLWDNTKKAEA